MRSLHLAFCVVVAIAAGLLAQAPPHAGPATQATARPAVGGKTYYIALEGAADTPGSIERPFATYQQAHAVLRAGDSLCYRGGVYTNPAAFIAYATKLDAAGQRITIKPHPGETVVFDNKNRGGGLASLGGSGAIVEGFEFRNSDGTAPRPEGGLDTWCPGIMITGSHHTVRRNWIHDITGIGFGNLGSMRLQNSFDNEVCHNAFERLWAVSGGARWNVNHIILFGGGNQRIHGNYFSHTEDKGQGGIFQKHAAAPDTSSAIFNNTFEEISGFGVDITGTGYRVHHNLFINSMMGAYISGGHDIPFEHNTLVGSRRTLLDVRGNCTIFKNNILYSTAPRYDPGNGGYLLRLNHYGRRDGHAQALKKDDFENNCYFNPGLPFKISFFGASPDQIGGVYDLAGWQAVSPGRDAGSVEADPQFVDLAARNFRTRPGSPAAKMGVYSDGTCDPPLSPSAAVGRRLPQLTTRPAAAP